MKKLSLITTVYKKENVVVKQLSRLYTFLSNRKIDFEILVVIDGDQPATKRKIFNVIKGNGYSRIKVFPYVKNMGKGYALRYGIERASGEIIGFIDADMDIDLKTLDFLLEEMNSGALVAIPSKYHKGSNIKFTPLRKLISQTFFLVNRIFVSLPKGVSDVSCGAKLFRGNILKQINPYLEVNGFAIDSEILFYIRKLNIPVSVVPFIANINTHETTVTIPKTLRVMLDILIIFKKRFFSNMNYKDISKLNLRY